MAKQLIEEALEKETKAAPMPVTSAKKRSKLSTKDDSELTSQDRVVLAMLAELKEQGYSFRVVNFYEAGEKTAAIILTGRVWK